MIFKNIAIYWGSFNPPTKAHSQIIEKVLEETSVEKIILTPSWTRTDKDFKIDEKQRRRLIKIFFEILKWKWLNIELEDYFLEWKNWKHTTTAQEEEYFREKLWFSPWFIYGSDVIPQMPTWSENIDMFIEKNLKKIFINRPWYDFFPNEYSIENFTFIDIPDMLNVSSSLAKEMLVNKQSVKWILLPEIEEYIRENRLYTT